MIESPPPDEDEPEEAESEEVEPGEVTLDIHASRLGTSSEVG